MHRLSNQIRAVVAGILLLAILAFLWHSITSLTSLGETVDRLYVESAVQQAEDAIVRLAEEQSRRYDARFRRYLQQVASQGAALARFYDRDTRLDDPATSAADILPIRYPNGAFGNSPEAPVSVGFWGGPHLTDELRRELLAGEYLDPILVEAQAGDPLVTGAWVITRSGIGRYTPNTDPHRALPPGFDLRNPAHDPVYSVAVPEFNPDKQVRYGKLYMDAAGQGVIVSAVAPVYRADGRFVAATGVDIALRGMRQEILNFTGFTRAAETAGFAFLVAADGRAIAFPPSRLGLLGLSSPEQLLDLNLLGSSNARFATLVKGMIAAQPGSVGLARLHLREGNYYVAHSSMPSTGWTLGLAYPEDGVRRGSEVIAETANRAVHETISRIGGAAVLGFVLFGALITVFLRYRLLRPLEGLNASAKRIASGDLQTPIDTSGRDELATLAANLSSMRDAVAENIEKLRDSERILQSIIDNANAAIYVKDAAGRFLLVNDHCCQLLGTTPEEAIGKRDRDVLPPVAMVHVTHNDQCVIDTATSLKFEESIPVGSKIHTFLSLKFPLRDHRGELSGVCGISTDITERKRTERELEQHRTRLSDMVDERTRELSIARERAEAASRAKTSFLANMSHEIRTPMNGVLSLAQLLEQSELSDKDRHTVKLILNAGRALMTLLKDILDYSRIEAGELSIAPAVFSLEHLVRDIEGLMVPLAEQKHLSLQIVRAPALPDHVVGDATRLRQVMLNLVGNAIKFTDSGTVALRLSDVSGGDNPVRLRVEVEDTGPGIPQGDRDAIFERFFRAGIDSDRARSGSGLGLSISQKIVGLMGGRIRVSSVPGQGSCFHFETSLPKAVTGPVDDTANARQELTPSNMRVLLADDDRISRFAFRALLEKAGHRVTTAEDGSEALRALEADDFDLVLMDVHMPMMDGLEATRRIRRSADPKIRDIPVLALTASVMNDEHERYLTSGITAVLAKPLSMEELNRTIRQALPARQAAPTG